MKTILLSSLSLAFCLNFSQDLYSQTGSSQSLNLPGRLEGNLAIEFKKTGGGTWGIYCMEQSKDIFVQTSPASIEVYSDSLHYSKLKKGYDQLEKTGNGFTGTASIGFDGNVLILRDFWEIKDGTLHFKRELKVIKGAAGTGIASEITFTGPGRILDSLLIFAPGIRYGSSNHLTASAIGGRETQAAMWIREDRLPAPLFGIMYPDGHSICALDPKPNGTTSSDDAHDLKVKTMIDTAFKFGALGLEIESNQLKTGFTWPGNEGEVTYTGGTYPGGQLKKWRRRYHSLQSGFSTTYSLIFSFGTRKQDFPDWYSDKWRWAWTTLKPQLNPQNIPAAKRSLIDLLSSQTKTYGPLTGIPNFTLSVPATNPGTDTKTVMGFTGKALETANFLLQDAETKAGNHDELHRRQATGLIESFIKTVRLNPPNGEGFQMKTGKPALAIGGSKVVYLRSFGDDLKSLLLAVKREKALGIAHPDWQAWAQTYADWLLPQQTAQGGFPRSWFVETGKIIDSSTQSSYTVIPFLLLLSELSSNTKYRQAASRAANFCWENGQNRGVFVGGTIDNPDVIDKEAGTLSLEAYLAMFGQTRDKKWIQRARKAANYCETWVYLWNIPMVETDHDDKPGWKIGVNTTGIQLISSGHSLVDAYMSFDADEFARLSTLTGDKHYLKVAAILLHNTKGMLALPNRSYDLLGPGWQQEHWSFAPDRGNGLHRGWLPWVATSQLNGIFGLETLDPKLLKHLSEIKSLDEL